MHAWHGSSLKVWPRRIFQRRETSPRLHRYTPARNLIAWARGFEASSLALFATEEMIMKLFLMGTALLISSAAIAQTTTTTDTAQPAGAATQGTTGTTSTDTTTGTTPTDTTGSNGTTATDTTTSSTTSTGTTATDAGAATGTTTGTMSGDTTGSSMGTTGSGTVSTATTGNMAPPPEPRASYPRCSRTVTDNCVQDERRARDTRRSRR
jgi:cytoskeletal protein RodZ